MYVPLRELKPRLISIDKVTSKRINDHEDHAVEDGSWLYYILIPRLLYIRESG